MGDIVKIAVKTALIAVVTAAIIVLFATVQIPGLDFTYFNQGVSTALAVVFHWLPAAQIIFPLMVTMLGLQLAILLFEFGMIAVRWVFKVNE